MTPPPLDTDQETAAPAMGVPPWSRTSVTRLSGSGDPASPRWPSPETLSIEVGTKFTVTAADWVVPPDDAVIIATPSATPVTRPDPSTVATAASLDSHENSAPVTAGPFPSNASAVSCTVSPNAVSSAVDGDTTTEATDCITVTTADPDGSPALAVTVASPLAAAVTKPDASTVATELALLLQVTVAPTITLAFWSRTSAVSCTVSPNAVSSSVAGLTVTVVGRAGSGGGGVVGLSPSPHPLAKATTASTADSRTMVRGGLMGMLLHTRQWLVGARGHSQTIANDSLHQAQLMCSISDDPTGELLYCEATTGGQIRDRSGQVSVEWGEEMLAVAAGSWRLRHHEPAYPLGPHFAGPRQGLAGGCAPSDPPNGNGT